MATAAAGASTPVPSIHLSGTTLTGAHFLPRKTVKVSIASQTTLTLSTKPAGNGSFKLTLATDPLSACGGVVNIRATGPRGEWASLSIPQPYCTGGSTASVSGTAADGSTVGATG